MTTTHSYATRAYTVIPYDSAWPRQFAEYAETIRNIFGNVRIEHIGSTSVPGMDGKPCIDVLVIVTDINTVEEYVPEMEAAGFDYAGAPVKEDARLFRKMQSTELIANIHVFPEGHPHIRRMLTIRDYLRTHPEEVRAYSQKKRELKNTYPDDYAAYRKNKDVYMEALQARACRDAAPKT